MVTFKNVAFQLFGRQRFGSGSLIGRFQRLIVQRITNAGGQIHFRMQIVVLALVLLLQMDGGRLLGQDFDHLADIDRRRSSSAILLLAILFGGRFQKRTSVQLRTLVQSDDDAARRIVMAAVQNDQILIDRHHHRRRHLVLIGFGRGGRRSSRFLVVGNIGPLLSFADDMRLAPGVALAGPPLELDAASGAVGLRRLVFGASAVPESRSHPEEILARVVRLDGALQPEESVMLHRAFPQMFGRFLVV